MLYQGEDVPSHSKGIFNEEWVDRLYRGIKRNTTKQFRFVCYVDKPYEFTEPVEQIPFKLPYKNMFSLLEPFGDDLGKVLFVGLDTIITGNIDHLFELEGFWMLRDPYFPERDCSGVMVFSHQPTLWQYILDNHDRLAYENTMFGMPSDMIFLDKVKHQTLEGPDNGIFSYKVHIKEKPCLVDNSCIVYFHGKEKPHELSDEWVRRHWGERFKFELSTTDELNNDREVMLSQFAENIKRTDLKWFDGEGKQSRSVIIVGGGPSLQDNLPKLQFLKKYGDIFALNGTHDFLIERGIVPDYLVLLDSRPENVTFVQSPIRKSSI